MMRAVAPGRRVTGNGLLGSVADGLPSVGGASLGSGARCRRR
jgi:hypothetical protein